jgi:hypothetical protein
MEAIAKIGLPLPTFAISGALGHLKAVFGLIAMIAGPFHGRPLAGKP